MHGTSVKSDSLESLLQRYNTMLFRVAYTRMQNRSDAEDVVQETWLRYLRASPALEDEEHRKAWLLKVCMNCANSSLSSAWRRRTTELDETLPDEGRLEDSVSDLYQTIAQLPDKYRTVIHLFYYEDQSVKQIAQILSLTETAVKTQLHRAREMLKKALGGEYDDL